MAKDEYETSDSNDTYASQEYKRYLSEDAFWEIVGRITGAKDPENAIRPHLDKLTVDELLAFQAYFDKAFVEAYRWDMWGAAHVVEGGCNEDDFVHFLHGVISRGKDVYDRALADPDSLAELGTLWISDETFGYVAEDIYGEKTGEEMPDSDVDFPFEPIGQVWNFKDADECRRRYPRLVELTEREYEKEVE